MLMISSNITYHVPVARWEPNTRERLVRAAVDLFADQGYAATTVSEIAERAGGLSKMTFFRHFPDKREVLFADQDKLGRLLADVIAVAPGSATPLQAVAAGLDALAALQRPAGVRRPARSGHRRKPRAAGARRVQALGPHRGRVGRPLKARRAP